VNSNRSRGMDRPNRHVMKHITHLIGLCALLPAFGCATSPTYVGSWKCLSMPRQAQEDGVVAATLHINAAGGFAGAFERSDGSVVGGFSGRWETNGTGGIDFVMTEGNGPETGTGQLIDKDTLLGVGGEVSLKFTRQK
jgi:hypothetical protein